MNEFVWSLSIPFLAVALGLFVIAGLIWLFYGDGIDKLKHPEEWKDKGSSGERAIWISLTSKYHVPENQIVRNAYIPTQKGTSEIDLLVVSKKGILVFECKNYSGNVYGDGNKRQWIQYVGKKKSYFYSPVLQNRGHVKAIKEYFNIEGLPVIPFVSTTRAANWKLKNISPDDHVLGWTDQKFKDIYDSLPDSEVMKKNYSKIMDALRSFERPDESVREEHIKQIKQ